MFRFIKYQLLIFYVLASFLGYSQSKKINLKNYTNKAQGYAILSAQYAKDAYYFTYQNVFEENTKDQLIENYEMALKFCEQALLYADTTLLLPKDSTIENIHAERVMNNARKNQLKAIELLESILALPSDSIVGYLAKKPMYFIDNAIVEAYAASLDFNGKTKSIEKKASKEWELHTNEIEEQNLLYRVQLGLFKRKIPVDFFGKVYLLTFDEVEGGLWRYSVGNFGSYSDAKLAEQTIETKGYDAFVIPMLNGTRITIEQALDFEKNK